MSMLVTDDAELYYELHGDGPPLVFIHGASGTHLSWWQQVAELRYHYSCLIYDLRGYGRSRASGEYDPGDGMAHQRDLERLIAHAGFGDQPLNLMGASLGTAPALHYAAEHAQQIASVILCCGPGCVSTPLIRTGWDERTKRMQARYRQVDASASPLPAGVPAVRSPGEKERFATAYHPYGPVGEAMHLDFPALTFLYAEIMASAGGPPTPSTFPVFSTRPLSAEEAATLNFPLLVVGGTEDPLFSVAELEQVASLFPNGRSCFFKGAGHLAYYERPRRFNDTVMAFLRDPSAVR
jgi:pimeloyl-ACP methyl ester carboxylesterase